MVRRVCARKLRDIREADEIAQAAFVAAYERLDSCNGDRRFGAWVQVIANNLCIDHMRAAARTTPSDEPVERRRARSERARRHAAARRANPLIQQALAALPDRQRDVVVARDVDGRRPPEIAAALGLSLGAVDSLLLRARRRLAASVQSMTAESGAASIVTTAAVTAVGGAATHIGPIARVAQLSATMAVNASYHVAASMGMVPGMPSMVSQPRPQLPLVSSSLLPLGWSTRNASRRRAAGRADHRHGSAPLTGRAHHAAGRADVSTTRRHRLVAPVTDRTAATPPLPVTPAAPTLVDNVTNAVGNTYRRSRRAADDALDPRHAVNTSSATIDAMAEPSAEDDTLKEACGVFGVYAPGRSVSHLIYDGLFALQHRGQESAGMAVSDGRGVEVTKDMGLVSNVFNEFSLAAVQGHLGIGHTRYSTTGSSEWHNAQPVYRTVGDAGFALGHNGNLTNTVSLVDASGMLPGTVSSDSDLIGELVAPRLSGRGIGRRA